MFCSKCGHEVLSEGTKFCPKCGAPLPASQESTAPAQETEVKVEEPIEETVEITTEPIADDPTEELKADEPVIESEPKPKKKKGWLIALIIVLVAAIAAVVVCLLLGVFDSPQKIVAKTISKGEDDFIAAYETGYNAVEKAYKDVNGDMNFSVEASLGEQTKDMINSFGSSMGMDLDWINSASANVALDVQENQMGLDIKGSLNGQEIGTINAIVDGEAGKAYLSAPEVLKDAAFSTDLDVSSEEYFEFLSSYTENLMTYSDKYPTSEELDRVLEKYEEILIKDLATAEMTKSKSEITAGDVTAKYTEIAISLDDKIANQLAVDFIETLKSDEDLKEVMRPLFEAQLQSEVYKDIFEDYDDYWKSMTEVLEESQKAAQDELDAIEENPDENEDLGVLYLYIDRAHNCRGFCFQDDEDSVKVEFYAPIDGNKTGIELKITSDDKEEFLFEGQGEVKSNLLNGEYTCKSEGDEIFTVKVADFDVKEYNENRNYKGKLVFNLGTGFSDVLDEPSIQAFTLADYELTFDTEGLNGTFDLNVLAADKSLFELKTTFSMDDVTDMTVPSKIIDFNEMDEEDPFGMFKEMNLAPIVTNLEKAGVPSEYYEKLKTLSDAIASGDDLEIAYAIMELTGQDVDAYEDDVTASEFSEEDMEYLASLSYEDFEMLYSLYDTEASTEDIKEMYDYIQSIYGE
ncbi:MAG: zinc ribbon domain-containing protein [Pseudobutyrivibrio sp.]|nr:zinc ribbon domain-containing protein [Pseudobutyrivibrio sp.]